MKVVVVEPDYAPYEKEINGLTEMQATVGGMIQAIYPYEERVAVVCNEEGILMGLPFNRSMEGGYNFLSGLMGTETCSEMNRALEHFELLRLVDNEQFFVTFLDMPFKVTENTVRHYVDQLRRKVLTPLQEVYGVDVSDDALRKAVAEHNEVCRILTEIGQFRKEENPRITGYEYHILNLVSYCCPKYLIVGKLRETLEELRQREPDVKPRFRVKIAVVGSEIDDPGFTKLVEDAGVAEVEDFVLWCDKFGAANNMSFTVVVSEDPEKATEAMKAYL